MNQKTSSQSISFFSRKSDFVCCDFVWSLHNLLQRVSNVSGSIHLKKKQTYIQITGSA